MGAANRTRVLWQEILCTLHPLENQESFKSQELSRKDSLTSTLHEQDQPPMGTLSCRRGCRCIPGEAGYISSCQPNLPSLTSGCFTGKQRVRKGASYGLAPKLKAKTGKISKDGAHRDRAWMGHCMNL